MCYFVIKRLEHLRSLEKCKNHDPFYNNALYGFTFFLKNAATFDEPAENIDFKLFVFVKFNAAS